MVRLLTAAMLLCSCTVGARPQPSAQPSGPAQGSSASWGAPELPPNRQAETLQRRGPRVGAKAFVDAPAAQAHEWMDDEAGDLLRLYSPDLVIRYADLAGVEAAQLAAIQRDYFDTRTQALEPESRLARARLELARALAEPRTDPSAVERNVDEAARANADLRKLWLGLLLRTRDALTPEQRAKLDLVRASAGAQGKTWDRWGF